MAQHGNPFIDFTKWVFKWIAIVIGGVIALYLVLIGGLFALIWLTEGRHVAKIHAVAINGAAPGLTAAELAERNEPCTDLKFPIFVAFTNGSTKTVENIYIEVSARLPGHSTNILEQASASMDWIVKPGDMAGQCWAFVLRDGYKNNPEAAKAVYSAKVVNVHFAE